MEYPQKLREIISNAPNSPGVYLMRDKSGKVIYVGKALWLKKRLLSYLGKDLSAKTQVLVSKIADIEFRICGDESMALLLEAGLIHDLKPKYNVSLRDDKSFPFIRVSDEKFPVVCISRKKKQEKGRYFGPYTDSRLLRDALKIIRRNFSFRSCKNLPKKSCLYYKINLCPAPCIGKISAVSYKRLINNIILILQGKKDLLIGRLKKEMFRKSSCRDFEAAARIRDQIIILSGMPAAQNSSNPTAQLEDLKNRLGLIELPVRIEGFDISNLAGSQAVGSMVSFYNAKADKNNYRRFRIKTFKGINDYLMLAEVLRRRYSRLKEEKKELPNLILIDGGKGHLCLAQKTLERLKISIPLVSIAKERENIYSSSNKTALDFPKDSPAMNLIRRIRDEAHRFAIGYHHILRRKELINN